MPDNFYIFTKTQVSKKRYIENLKSRIMFLKKDLKETEDRHKRILLKKKVHLSDVVKEYNSLVKGDTNGESRSVA